MILNELFEDNNSNIQTYISSIFYKIQQKSMR